MNRRLMSVMCVMVAVCALEATQAAAETWNAYSQFSTAAQTSSDVWQYLYNPTAGANSGYQPLAYSESNARWQRSTDAYSLPLIQKINDEVQMHPGGDLDTANWTAAAVLGWKNVDTTAKTVNVSFSLIDRDRTEHARTDGVAYWLVQSGAASGVYLADGAIANSGETGIITASSVSVAGGGMIYLQIGPMNYIDCDMTGVTFTVASVPEPSSLALLAAGIMGLLAYAWRKQK